MSNARKCPIGGRGAMGIARRLLCTALALALAVPLSGCSALSGQPENAFDAVCHGGEESLSANDDGLYGTADGLEVLWNGQKFSYGYEDGYLEENCTHVGDDGGWHVDHVYVDYYAPGPGSSLCIYISLERAEDAPGVLDSSVGGEFCYYPWKKELYLEDAWEFSDYGTSEEEQEVGEYAGEDYRGILCDALAFVVGDLLSRMDSGGGYSASDWGDFSFCDETDLGLTADDLAEAARGGE